MLTPEDQRSPAVHVTILLLHRHRLHMHFPAHKCTLGNAPAPSRDVTEPVHESHRILSHVSTANGTNQKPALAGTSFLNCARCVRSAAATVHPAALASSWHPERTTMQLHAQSQHQLQQARVAAALPQCHPGVLAFSHALLPAMSLVARLQRRMDAHCCAQNPASPAQATAGLPPRHGTACPAHGG